MQSKLGMQYNDVITWLDGAIKVMMHFDVVIAMLDDAIK